MNSSTVSRRSALLGAAALLGSPALPAAHAADAATPRLRLRGETSLPHRLAFKDTTVGGLSALDYDPAEDLWYALSDDRSDINPARFYTFRMALTAQGLARPVLQDVVLLRQADGSTYPSRRQKADSPPRPGPVPDPEGLRFRPATRTLLWSSEGDRKLGLDPFVREMTLDGRHQRELETPPHLKADPAAPAIGPRDNLGLEGLAISPDGSTAWAAMENALLQDGPMPSVSQPGGPCRITAFDLESGKPVRQIAYRPDAIPLPPLVPGTYADNGISEILMQSAQHMLVLERSYSLGAGNSLRLYQIDVTTGSNTLAEPMLRDGNHRPVAKTLVANFNQFRLQWTDNTEGMAWGPTLPGQNGGQARRTLVFVSDDNFNPTQTTQLVAFDFDEE